MNSIASVKWLGLLLWLAVSTTSYGFYNPTTGRWLSRDPIGEQGGCNVHAFVQNAPITRIDALGRLSLESIGIPGIVPNGSYAFAGVWFKFGPEDYFGVSEGGTLVWSRRLVYAINPCNTAVISFSRDLTMWFRKSFQLDLDGNLTGGDLWSQNNGPVKGLGLEVTGSSVEGLVQSSPGGNYDYGKAITACGSSGTLRAEVVWAIVPGYLAGNAEGRPDLNLWGVENLTANGGTPHLTQPPAGWSDWAGAIAQGTLSATAQWNQCANPATKSMSATSSLPVKNGGPNVMNKTDQWGGITYLWNAP